MLLEDKIRPIARLENLNEDSQSVLEEAIVNTQISLSKFAESNVFLQKITEIFGNSFDAQKLSYFSQSWLNGDFETLPEIEIRSQEDLSGANGAFATSTNKIYLAKEYIAQNSFNSGAIVDVLLEEVGHFVDASINKIDTVGDEGEIFSALVQGVELNEASVKLLKAENDIKVVNLDNQKIKVEQDTDNATDLSYTTDDTNSNPDDSISTLIDEKSIDKIKESFSDIEQNINNQIFTNSIPLIGDIFNDDNNPLNFIKEIQEAILNNVNQLKELNQLGTEAGVEEIQQALEKALNDALGTDGLNILKEINRVTNNLDEDEIKFSLKLSDEKSIEDRTIAVDIGVPFLGLKVGEGKESQLKVGLNYDFNFTFGINKTTGEFIFETPDDEDLKVNLEASIPDLEFEGQLGFLNVIAADEDADENPDNDGQDVDGDGTEPSSIKLGFSADLENGKPIDIKPIEDVVNINLELATNIAAQETLPSLSTDLNLKWNGFLDKANPELSFNNVQIDLGSLISTLTGPVFKAINKHSFWTTQHPVVRKSILFFLELSSIVLEIPSHACKKLG